MDIGHDTRRDIALPRWDIRFDARLDITSPDIVTAVARAEALARVIRDVPIIPDVQRKLDRLNILRAVRGTTGIEGAELTEDEVDLIMSTPPGERVLPASREREEKEARNAEEVMRFVAEAIGPNRPLSEELIKDIHNLTTRGIDYPGNRPGHYRAGPVRAGTYVAPDADAVPRLMQEFMGWFHDGPPREWPPAIQAIVAHFYVISIHPFQDGNGRTSRAVESFLLFRGGINARGFYSLANFYYRRRQEYENMLDYVRFETSGDLTPFVRFALNGLVEELEEVHAEVLHEVRLMAFRDYAREVIFEVGSSDQATRMYNLVLGLGREAVPVVALRRGGHRLYELYRNYSSRTLRRDLDFLSAEGLIAIENKEIRVNLDVMTQFAAPTPPTSS